MSPDNSALKIVRNIASWLAQMPASAVRLEVRQRHAIGGQQETLLAFECGDIRKTVESGSIEQIAASAYQQTANYAEAQGQECIFIAQFLDQIGAPIATTQWRIGSVFGDAAERPFDGSVQSMMSQNQTHIHAVLGMHLQGMDTMQKGYKEIIAILQRRISELEDRLFKAEKAKVDAGKVDPTGSEIQLAMMTLENEQESRRVQQFFDGVGQIASAIRAGRLPANAGPTTNGAGGGTTGSSATASQAAATTAPASSTPAGTTAPPSQPGTSDSAPASPGASSDASRAAPNDSAAQTTPSDAKQPPTGSAAP